MGQIQEPRPALLLVAAFSRYDEALDWARNRGIETWGAIALESPRYAFDFTTYYDQEMGTDLRKCFWAFEQPIDPAGLPKLKHTTNAWEEAYRQENHFPEPRPLNLDPGYLTEAKLILATTKDRDHRIYLSDGIFAECTLHFHRGTWRTRPWTYPDYQSAEYHEFFSDCRKFLRER